LDTSIQTDFDFFERGKTFGDDFVEDRMEKFYRVFGIDSFDVVAMAPQVKHLQFGN